MSTPRSSARSRSKAGGGRSTLFRVAVAISVLGAALTVFAARGVAFGLDHALPLVIMLVMGAASAGLRTRAAEEHVAFSFTAVVLLGSLVLLGPVGAVLAGVGAALLDARHRWSSDHLFNAAMIAFSTAVAAVAYRIAGGALAVDGALAVQTQRGWVAIGTSVPSLTEHVLLPLLAADAALFAANLTVLLLMRAPTAGEVRSLVVESLIYTIPLYLGHGVIAFILAVLWVPGRVGPLAALLITAPLLVTRWIHAQYAEEKRAHRRILETLVDAGTGPQGAAHADRVGAYAEAIGNQLGLRAGQLRVLRYAAMLHAIGSADGCVVESDLPAPE
ncbi:HD-GYP domain-containing protein [Gephyromycinifex aptenodytis]|uniref:hypothetical protein n=1 Tax=Gephyromycinifex aptenodytis TaxID=2716227 RepID=UPI00144572AD|nr:hypothetical protein [Gephyromycinifex aptenodytis]